MVTSLSSSEFRKYGDPATRKKSVIRPIDEMDKKNGAGVGT